MARLGDKFDGTISVMTPCCNVAALAAIIAAIALSDAGCVVEMAVVAGGAVVVEAVGDVIDGVAISAVVPGTFDCASVVVGAGTTSVGDAATRPPVRDGDSRSSTAARPAAVRPSEAPTAKLRRARAPSHTDRRAGFSTKR